LFGYECCEELGGIGLEKEAALDVSLRGMIPPGDKLAVILVKSRELAGAKGHGRAEETAELSNRTASGVPDTPQGRNRRINLR
jgi:hypothetical protein